MHDKSLTISARQDGAIDISQDNVVKATVRHPEATIAKFSSDGTQLYTSAAAGSSGILWQITGAIRGPAIPRESLPDRSPLHSRRRPRHHAGRPSDLVRFTPDGKQLITRATHTELWDVKTAALVKQLLPGRAYDVSDDGRYLLKADGAGFMRRVDIATGDQGPQIPVTERATLSPNGEYAVTFDKLGGVQFWRAETAQKLSRVAADISLKDPITSGVASGRLRVVGKPGRNRRIEVGDRFTMP